MHGLELASPHCSLMADSFKLKINQLHKSSRSQQSSSATNILTFFVEFRDMWDPTKDWRLEEINILGKSNASDSPQELDLEAVMKLSFLMICLLWVLFLEGQKPGPYFQIIFNNFSLESIFYEFLTDTNIHCRNES